MSKVAHFPQGDTIMSFFKNAGDELGTGLGKGIVVLVATFWKALCWLCRVEHKENEGTIKTNSFRIASWSIIFSIMFIPGLVTCSRIIPDTISNNPPFQQQKDTITIRVQLTDGSHPAGFPTQEFFEPLGDNTTNVYRDLGETRFFHYQKRTDGKPSRIRVNEKLCAMVPAGKEIYISTNFKPVFVANMENSVSYHRRYETLNSVQKFLIFVTRSAGDSRSYKTDNSWQFISDHWGEVVDSKNFVITGRALSEKDLIDKDAAGGIVCF